MANTQQQIDGIVKACDDAVLRFQRLIPSIEKQILDDVDLLIKSLEMDGTSISNSVYNLRTIGQIQTKINQIVRNPEYLRAVKQFTEAFDNLAKLLNEYGTTLSFKFTPSELLNEIKSQSVRSVIQALTEDGLRANIGNHIQDILRQNITSASTYSALHSQLSDFIRSNGKKEGALQRYTRQITTDAIQQFNGQYSQAITEHLGLKWNMYVGSLLTTSRQFCDLLVAKRYVYFLELPKIITGDIDGHKCEIYVKTGLPNGMIAGTNEDNFEVYRGGYNCGHSYIPVAENFVPRKVRIETYNRLGIEHIDGEEV